MSLVHGSPWSIEEKVSVWPKIEDFVRDYRRLIHFGFSRWNPFHYHHQSNSEKIKNHITIINHHHQLSRAKVRTMTEQGQHEEKAMSRELRRVEGRRRKKRLIEEGNGVRPRKTTHPPSDLANGNGKNTASVTNSPQHGTKREHRTSDGPGNHSSSRRHKFGRVMDSVPCRQKPRFSTLSISIPSSIVANCQTKELRTQLVGQIARAATIFHVDEIVVYDDKLSKESTGRQFRKRRDAKGDSSNEKSIEQSDNPHTKFDAQAFFALVLQYCETPQYLRRHFFPMHPDLQFVGLLAPVDAPHHVRADDVCPYREGVVLEKKIRSGGSLINCGVPGRLVEIPTRLKAGIRCTVKLDPFSYRKSGQLKGQVVSPTAPREADGTYWGYTTRVADSLKAVLDDSPFDTGYDLKIGTSERGDSDIDEGGFTLPPFQHAIIVFGGVAGIEECVDAEESLSLPGDESKKLFDLWLNVAKYQGSRTIRTEEAVFISLAKLSPALMKADSGSRTTVFSQESTPKAATNPTPTAPTSQSIDLSDKSVSEESSDGD